MHPLDLHNYTCTIENYLSNSTDDSMYIHIDWNSKLKIFYNAMSIKYLDAKQMLTILISKHLAIYLVN